jgi:hypothetical protein
MKITNEGSEPREYPTLGIILNAGESYDDAKAKVTPPPTAPSATSGSIEEEVK